MPPRQSAQRHAQSERPSSHQSASTPRQPFSFGRRLSIARRDRSVSRSSDLSENTKKAVDLKRPITPETQRRPSIQPEEDYTETASLQHDQPLYSSPSSTTPHNAHGGSIRPPKHSHSNSHGLTWSEFTSDSIVESLLSSLDHIPALSEDPSVRYANIRHPQSVAASPPQTIAMNRLVDFRSQPRTRSHACLLYTSPSPRD